MLVTGDQEYYLPEYCKCLCPEFISGYLQCHDLYLGTCSVIEISIKLVVCLQCHARYNTCHGYVKCVFVWPCVCVHVRGAC